MTEPPAPAALPPSLELAWGLRDRPTRGPKPGLTLERIVEAGIRVATTEGIAALSMSRVARELGAATMSLYRYVSAKDELLDLMVDTALGTPPPMGGGNWRDGLTIWATTVRDAYLANPWSLRVPITGPPLGPNNVALLDAGLSCLAATTLSEQQKVSTVLLLSGFVRNAATLLTDITLAAADSDPMPSYGSMLTELIGQGRFPAVELAIASGAFDDGDDLPDEGLGAEFDFGLRCVLDGVAELIERTAQT